jgi:hypothetical protein
MGACHRPSVQCSAATAALDGSAAPRALRSGSHAGLASRRARRDIHLRQHKQRLRLRFLGERWCFVVPMNAACRAANTAGCAAPAGAEGWGVARRQPVAAPAGFTRSRAQTSPTGWLWAASSTTMPTRWRSSSVSGREILREGGSRLFVPRIRFVRFLRALDA